MYNDQLTWSLKGAQRVNDAPRQYHFKVYKQESSFILLCIRLKYYGCPFRVPLTTHNVGPVVPINVLSNKFQIKILNILFIDYVL